MNTSGSTNIGLNENSNINKGSKMDKITNWFKTYNNEITWFIIGWMCFATLDQLTRGHYVMAGIDAVLAYFNYSMWKRNV